MEGNTIKVKEAANLLLAKWVNIRKEKDQ